MVGIVTALANGCPESGFECIDQNSFIGVTKTKYLNEVESQFS